MFPFFVVLVIAAQAAAFYLDYSISVRGLAKGVALEGNWVVGKLFGTKPTPKQLLIGLIPQDAAVTAIVIALAVASPYAGIIGFGVVAGAIVKHVQNYFAWKRLGA